MNEQVRLLDKRLSLHAEESKRWHTTWDDPPRLDEHRSCPLFTQEGSRRCVLESPYQRPPTWMAGRLVPSGSASRKTSWVTGAVSPSPKSKNRNRYTIGLPSVHPK